MVGAVSGAGEREWQSPASPVLGIHAPIAGGLHRSALDAAAKGCRTWQIFSRNPRGWAAKPLDPDEVALFRRTRAENGLSPCVIHACYLINLATGAPEIREKSVRAAGAALRPMRRLRTARSPWQRRRAGWRARCGERG
jgi:endonuclease IV